MGTVSRPEMDFSIFSPANSVRCICKTVKHAARCPVHMPGMVDKASDQGRVIQSYQNIVRPVLIAYFRNSFRMFLRAVAGRIKRSDKGDKLKALKSIEDELKKELVKVQEEIEELKKKKK